MPLSLQHGRWTGVTGGEGKEWVPKSRSISLSPVIQVALMTKILEMHKEYRRLDLTLKVTDKLH